ncbi:MAG: helix-turn-helix domain-containing protein [Alphaproteobacteria bacterium]|nr:helix-turn-helix domain-containing protein [Alphaproteobacteria bacterium]
MQMRGPWRDPDLSLAQLARRLSVLAKRLSVAVNLVTGDNILRYVNGCRVQAACAALQRGASVTEAMLDTGFLARSNVNREFRRVTGQTPTAWRAGLRPFRRSAFAVAPRAHGLERDADMRLAIRLAGFHGQAAEPEIFRRRVADGPFAGPLGQLQQG